jgi:hypothetical protein
VRLESLIVVKARLPAGISTLPAVALAQVGDVGDVVLAMPGVKRDVAIEFDDSEFRMLEFTAEVFGMHSAENGNPACVKVLEQRERDLDRNFAAVVEFGPGGFVVRLDAGFVFCERELEAHVGVDVRVGNVVNDLANGPSAGAIRRVELLGSESGNSGAHVRGASGDDIDVPATIILCAETRVMKSADGIREVWSGLGTHGEQG